MALNVQQLAGPLIEPITLAQMHAQCRVDASFTGDDSLFAIYGPAARQVAEKVTRRAFFNQTWQRTLDNFPIAGSFDYTSSPADRWNAPTYGALWNRLAIDLPKGRALAINSIGYVDGNGNPQTLSASSYSPDLSGDVPRLFPAQISSGGQVWPFTGVYQPGSVNIQWQAGSYVQKVTETFTVPSSPGPYVYNLLQPGVTGGIAVSTTGGTPVPVSGWSATYPGVGTTSVLTLPSAQAGATLSVTYYVANTPANVLVALLMLVAHFYRNPEATTDLEMKDLPFGVQALLGSEVIEWTDYCPC